MYEGDVELELPEGLIGIYGPNGAGKSYLIEAIPWALYGYARDRVDEVRTTGVNDECIVELDFEHEGHTVRGAEERSGRRQDAEARSGDLNARPSGGHGRTRRGRARPAGLLGMNEKGFLASVFAEQKQLASLSSQTPGERRKLVLDLLGISPSRRRSSGRERRLAPRKPRWRSSRRSAVMSTC